MNNLAEEILQHSFEDLRIKQIAEVLDFLEPYLIMSIIITGLIGNSISFWIFSFTKLKYIFYYKVLNYTEHLI